jgi:hypothetical protein
MRLVEMAQTMHRVVMSIDAERTDERREEIVYVPNEDEGSDLMESYTMDYDVWTRMHKPSEITVTVEKGNVMKEPELGTPKTFSGPLSDVQKDIGGTRVDEATPEDLKYVDGSDNA